MHPHQGRAFISACVVMVQILIVGSILWFIFAPKKSSRDVYNVSVAQADTYAGEDLDLQAIGQLVEKAKDAPALEEMINKPEINNLDLNRDGKVDYIKVSEYGEGTSRGFSLTVDVTKDEEQEIATIDIVKSGEQADVEIRGNKTIYGSNHYYHSRFGVGDAILLAWLFSPRPVYYSPYYYGHYPRYYGGGYGYRSTSVYRSGVSRTYNSGTSRSRFTSKKASSLKSKATSPNASKTAKSIKAPLKQPTASQKSFQQRNPSKQTKSGGFGKKTSSSSSSSYRPTVRSSSSSRSGGYSRGK